MRPRARRSISPSSIEPQRSQVRLSATVCSSPAREPKVEGIHSCADAQPSWNPQVELQKVDRSFRSNVDRGDDRVTFDGPVAIDREPGAEPGPAFEGESRCDE